LANFLNERVEPKCAQLHKLMESEHRAAPIRLIVLPNLVCARVDIELPSCKKSMTLAEEPKRVTLKMLTVEPNMA
jgi:hypothetical protein